MAFAAHGPRAACRVVFVLRGEDERMPKDDDVEALFVELCRESEDARLVKARATLRTVILASGTELGEGEGAAIWSDKLLWIRRLATEALEAIK